MARSTAQMGGFWDWFKSKPQSEPQGPGPQINVDLYGILGVPPSSSQEEIKKAFREQAMKFHPDRNPDDPLAEAKYAEISSAYAILGDEARRSAYDRARPAPEPLQPRGGGIIPRTPSREAPVKAEEPSRKISKRLEPKSMIEHMFGVAKEEGQQGSLFQILAPGQPTPPPARIPVPGTPFANLNPTSGRVPIMPSVEVPDDNELWYILQHWPLDWIFEVARADRNSPEFQKAGAMAIDVLAGGGPTAAELDIAELFGIDKFQAREFINVKGREGFFANVLHPLFSRVTAMMDKVKPVDIPGSFFLDWDPSGKMMELVYAENVRRR